ncbi:hypothetical protein ACFLYA_02290 [Candidatus Dependentiae bacterium]
MKNFIYKYLNPRNFTKVGNSIILLVISVIFVIAFLAKPITTFISTDPEPQIEPISRKMGHVGYKVEAGMHIENFHAFDLTKNNFVLNAIVWFKFNPAVLSLDTIEKFSFEKGDILSKSKPITKLVENKVLAQYRIKFKFTTNLDYRLFPFDNHRIFITLTNKSVSPKEMVFEASESGLTLSKNMLIPGWKEKYHKVTTGYSESLLDRNDPTTKILHPVIVFALDFMRSGMRQVFVLLIPLLLIFYIAMFSLTLGKDQYARKIAISLGNIASFIGYRFVVERVSPQVGYLMFIDNAFHLLLFLTFVIFFINLATKKKEYTFFRGTAILSIHILFLIAWYYLCHIWVFE